MKAGLRVLMNLRSYYLKESASIAEALPYGKGYSARASYRLSSYSADLGEDQASERYRKMAETTRDQIPTADEGLTEASNDAERFDNLVPWMLW